MPAGDVSSPRPNAPPCQPSAPSRTSALVGKAPGSGGAPSFERDAERRARQMRLVNDVALRLSSIHAVEELLWEVVRLIQETFGYYYVHINTVDPERAAAICRAGWGPSGPRNDLVGLTLRLREQGMVGWVGWSGEPLIADDVDKEPRYYFDRRLPSTRSEITVPIKRGDRTIGVLDAQDVRLAAFDRDDVILLETLARQIAVALENAYLFEELKRSRAALEEKARALDELVEHAARAQEEDRRRIALDLHDGVAQLVVGARFELESLRMSRPPLPPSAVEQLDAICAVLDECSDEMRRVVFDLYPPSLQDLGLVPTVQRYLTTFRRLSGMDCSFRTLGRPVRLPVETELAAYRIVQEALSNVLKHASAPSVEVVMRFGGSGLRVSIQDTGKGFDTSHPPTRGRPCFGLESMRRKAARGGAILDVQSTPGRGTTVLLTIPYPAGNAWGLSGA